jgi:hypothetical protein
MHEERSFEIFPKGIDEILLKSGGKKGVRESDSLTLRDFFLPFEFRFAIRSTQRWQCTL